VASVRLGLALAWRNVAPRALAEATGMAGEPPVSAAPRTRAEKAKATGKGKKR
jgi:hypothetical protein